MDADLLTPILLGTKNINFFEGRLLSARDLREEQAANRDHDRQLGRAIGAGIIEGLEVDLENDGADGSTPLVTVKKGLALDHEGEVIGLPDNDVRVALSRTFDVKPTSEADFYACAGPPSSTFLATGVGLYVLAVTPAAGFKERAPKIGLGDEGVVKGCGSRYIQEGVRFRLVELTKPLLTTLDGLSDDTVTLLNDDLLSNNNPVARGDEQRLSLLRNMVAHLCFGSEQLGRFAADPFTGEAATPAFLELGALSRLWTLGQLEQCDVPLVLIYWTLDGIAFLDAWSVRRQVTGAAGAASGLWWTGGQPPAVSDAIILQFQDQLGSLLTNSTVAPSTISAEEYFYRLPPAGLLPLISANRPRAFSRDRFFESYAIEPPKRLAPMQIRAVLHEAQPYSTIDLGRATSIQLYEVPDTAIPDQLADVYEPHLVFADVRVPYFSDQPRFGGLCSAMTSAESAYHSLIDRGVFLADETNPGSAPSRTLVMGAIGHVSTIAASWRAIACTRLNERAQALAAMRSLYEAQAQLVEIFRGPLPGVRDLRKVRAFAGELSVLLDGTPGFLQQSLADALDEGSLPDSTDAQNRINQFVASWSGAVTTGNIRVVRTGSSRGLTIVKDDPAPFEYFFLVTNRTNRTLDIQLNAEFEGPDESWSDFVTVLDSGGTEVLFVRLEPFDSGRADNSAAEAELRVSVLSPTPADRGESGTLTLTASVPPPVSLGDDDGVLLDIGTAEGPAEGDRVEVPSPTASGSLDSAEVDVPLRLTFDDLLYVADTGPDTRLFTLSFDVSSTTVENRYFIETPTAPFTLESNVPSGQILTAITPLSNPDAVGTTLVFEVVVRSEDGEVETRLGPLEVTTVA